MKHRTKILKDLNIGMIGAALLVIAEWLVLATGSGNDRNGIIDSNWALMPMTRFGASVLLSAVGLPFFYIGLKSLNRTIRTARRKRSLLDLRMCRIFGAGVSAAAISCLFLHGVLSILPIVYKLLYATSLMGADISAVVESVYYYLAIPFWVYLILSAAGLSIPFLYFLWEGRLRCSRAAVVCNPLVMWGVGALLRLLKSPVIRDFASASLMFGMVLMLLAAISHVTEMPTEEEAAEIRERRRMRRMMQEN